MGRMWSHDTDDARLEAGSRRMTDAEQALAVLGGSVLTLWALRHGRLLPSLVLACAAPWWWRVEETLAGDSLAAAARGQVAPARRPSVTPALRSGRSGGRRRPDEHRQPAPRGAGSFVPGSASAGPVPPGAASASCATASDDGLDGDMGEHVAMAPQPHQPDTRRDCAASASPWAIGTTGSASETMVMTGTASSP